MKPYTKREVKNIAGVTYNVLNKWNESGALKWFTVGGRVYYEKEYIDMTFKL